MDNFARAIHPARPAGGESPLLNKGLKL